MEYKKEITIGSRKSNLAKKQTEILINKLRSVGIKNINTRLITTKGDIVNARNFKKLGGKGLFTKNIDQLILKKSIDIGVHSTKDMPAILDKNLQIGAFIKRENPRDVLVTRDKFIKSLNDLPLKCTIGTSSPRRVCYIKQYRPDITVVPIKGNIETRIKQVKDKKIFGTILAAAGIKRINYKEKNIFFNFLSLSLMLPAPGQGAIAIVHRREDIKIKNICKLIDDEKTRIAVEAERALIKNINGDCFTPIGAYAKVVKDNLLIKARLYSTDGKFFVEEKLKKKLSCTKCLGKLCAQIMLKKITFKYNNS